MPEPADLLLVDTDVWCGDAARRWATAVAIRGDRIVAVGTDDEVRDRKGPGTQVLSLAGKAVVPGFQDSHIHPALRRPQPVEREPRRSARPRGLPGADQGRRRREPRARLDRGRRVVQPGAGRDRWPPQGGPGRDRARPAGVPDELRRARGLGELPRAGGRGPQRRFARPVGRLSGARPRWFAHRLPAGGRRLHRAPRGDRAAERGPMEGLRASRAAGAARARRDRLAGRVG